MFVSLVSTFRLQMSLKKDFVRPNKQAVLAATGMHGLNQRYSHTSWQAIYLKHEFLIKRKHAVP